MASVCARHRPGVGRLWRLDSGWDRAGGGIKSGVTIGKTDDLGMNVVEDPVHVNDLQATILHCLGLDHTRLTYRHMGRDFRLTDVQAQRLYIENPQFAYHVVQLIALRLEGDRQRLGSHGATTGDPV